MGFFKIKRSLAVAGGSVQIGDDANIYRTSANVLKTDDGLTIAGAVTAQSSLTVTGTITGPSSGTTDLSSGTVVRLPYHTVSPSVAANGQIAFLQKTNRSYLLYQAGGTPCYITLPQTTDGTIAITVGGTP